MMDDNTTPVAVIDIGTSSIRMAIAEINYKGQVRTLETLAQAVNLGKDTFTNGKINKSTIEDCVRVLQRYGQILKQYQVDLENRVRAIATSAVREAENRLAFLDRIYIATGIHVAPLDAAEVNRITYMGIQPYLTKEPTLSEAKTLITEIGSGSTEVLFVQGDQVLSAHTHRLGSLRVQQNRESVDTSQTTLQRIMRNQIDQYVEQITNELPENETSQLIALGGDVRFAATQLISNWNRHQLGHLNVSELEGFCQQVMELNVETLVNRYHLSFPDAETLGPALLAYTRLAAALQQETILVSNVNLRDGLLHEMAAEGVGTETFHAQVIHSALELGRKFHFQESHATHVARLRQSLFSQLKSPLNLEPRYELILHIAALLHEIGLYISSDGYHKHSMYLINHSELFGLSEKELLLVGLVARYHRRASPKASHQGYGNLDRNNRVAVAKMAAILRIADALDHSRSQRCNNLECHYEEHQLVISIPGIDEVSLEQLALKETGTLFDEIFGMQVLLRQSSLNRT